MSSVAQLLKSVRASGVRRPGCVKTMAMGREHEFQAYDLDDDTYVFEKGIGARLGDRPSVLIVEKRSLGRKGGGMVMTLTTGNHSVAAFPLLDGRLWGIATLQSSRRGDVLLHEIVCANVVGTTLELSQRDVSTKRLVAIDSWLCNRAGLSLANVVMCERNDLTLDHYRRLGQEWRVKPLAWTENEMRVALAASRKRMSTGLTYYHSTKGVHFLTFPEFARFADLARTKADDFVAALRELVGVYEGNSMCFVRMPKHRGHHEIEFFGVCRGAALERLIPELESLLEAIDAGCIGQLGVIQKIQDLVALYQAMLSRPELANEESSIFVETIYMYITGEVYSVMGEGLTPAFDDRRTALVGATFVKGRPVFHPGADERTEILLSNIRSLMSKDESVEYANVYELRSDEESAVLGKGSTREIVYKTTLSPLEHSLVEKRLSHAAKGYGSYMIARVEAFKALGMTLSEYRLLRRRGRHGKKPLDYYIRRRCEGEPMSAIPSSYFCSVDDSSVEDGEVVRSLALLMGDAAAQNMAMKKFDQATESPFFGIGKEIYQFEYDIAAQRVMPKRVSTCSVRGSFGWPNLSYDDENLQAMASFYLQYYAHALKDFQRAHGVPMEDLAERFMDGFEHRTHAMAWQLSVMRDWFEPFRPDVPKVYSFEEKWRFAMWALDRQERRLPLLKKMFLKRVRVLEDEDIRSDS